MKQIGFFDEAEAYRRLSQLGDCLEWVDKAMDWSMFLPLLDEVKPDRTRTSKGGRPPYSNLLMFKILILQHLYSVSNDSVEFQINDRLSWKRFPGLSLSDKVPDATTVWLFREALINNNTYDALFLLFNQRLLELGVITNRGSIVDASFVDAPRQRNTREQNRVIKEGGIPEGWELAENAPMLAQKDLDARWAKKGEEVHYGYKDHVLVDADSKIIINYQVTAAHVHDSRMLMPLLEFFGEDINVLFGDSAFLSEEMVAEVLRNYPHIRIRFNEKGKRNYPLTDEQRQTNRLKSRVRARIEHVFGHMENSMGGMLIRSIGIIRADCTIGLKNLAYNISRYATLCRLGRAPSMV